MPRLREAVRTLLERTRSRLARFRMPVWYSADYRLPLASVELRSGMDPRRADLVAWYLLEHAGAPAEVFRQPRRARFAELQRVHTPRLIESLTDRAAMAAVFAVDPDEVPLEALLTTVRLVCGGTIDAAREALQRRGPAQNLLGGFHHAAPDRAVAFSPVNDIAIAIAALRAERFRGRVVILDLDAHPPDGTAACLEDDDRIWIGSLSGSDWGALPGVDETVLPEACGDEAYLAALDRLLGRMPRAPLVFVVAGGDVLAGDRLGMLGLSLAGAQERDRRVARALEGTGSVWLPAGGYHADSWRVLAATAMVVATGARRPIPASYDPMGVHYANIGARLGREVLTGGDEFGLGDLEADLFGKPSAPEHRRLLGYWSPSGLEYALFQYGILDHLRRLGYDRFRVVVDTVSAGERFRLFGSGGGVEHLLVEAVLERHRVGQRELLFVNWLTLRNPRAAFQEQRPPLPGQEVPGLGLAREAGNLLFRMASRLGLDGVSFCPSHYHLAYGAREQFRFVDPERQGRFEALVRDLADLPLTEATRAVSEGRVLENGRPYQWEPSEMVYGTPTTEPERRTADRVRDHTHFHVGTVS